MENQPLTIEKLTQAQLAAMSPMMRQYLTVKAEHGDCIIMYRLGDFYEMFFDDALLVSAELGLTLTGRDCGLEARAPMCGIPYHAASPYINALSSRGHRVAICEQLTEQKGSKQVVERVDGKSIVQRKVIRVITPGTVTDETVLDEKTNNYCVAIYQSKGKIGYAYADVSVGTFFVGELTKKNAARDMICELSRISPTEVIVKSDAEYDDELISTLHRSYYWYKYDEKEFDKKTAEKRMTAHFGEKALGGVLNMQYGICAAGAVLSYFSRTQMNALVHVNKLSVIIDESYMHLDDFTRFNLELLAPIRRDVGKSGTLLYVLDCTHTPMGGRLIKEWISQPLQSIAAINGRLDAVEELVKRPVDCDNLKAALRGMCDVERLCAKLSYGTLNPKNCVAIRYALSKIWQVRECLKNFSAKNLQRIYSSLDTLDDLRDFIAAAIIDEPPINIKDGGVIRNGFDEELDKYRQLAGTGREWLTDLEKREKQATGIKNLRIGYNRAVGYYFEVSKSFISMVPERFLRRQTLTNCERYYTEELRELEEKASEAQELCLEKEFELFEKVQSLVLSSLTALQKDAELIAVLDVYQSFATAAIRNDYVRPTMNIDDRIDIKDGRHPVVEKNMPTVFNPNDAYLDAIGNRIMMITGPNMAGKSTYMRQTALIVLMAHIGCFVSAKSADICIVDKIFTRVGASDSLASGQSTFMVEMSEMACILETATEHSLVILDEIGRGTSTYDGVSIARAVLEYIAKVTRSKTLFATHYHELTSLDEEYPCIKNYSVQVRELGDNIVFMHKIVEGGTDRSFGIQVAALAGLPKDVVNRAKQLLIQHEGAVMTKGKKPSTKTEEEKRRELIAMNLYNSISALDPNALSPLEALSTLFSLYALTKEE